jgi:hypothetical protein
MRDITSPKLLYLKGFLFLLAGILSASILVWKHPSLQVVLLLAIAVWCFARAYYFAFYVVGHYVDPSYRFAGLIDFARYAVKRRRLRNHE